MADKGTPLSFRLPNDVFIGGAQSVGAGQDAYLIIGIPIAQYEAQTLNKLSIQHTTPTLANYVTVWLLCWPLI